MPYHDAIFFNWNDLREYPYGFGVRFAQAVKHLKKERSKLTNPVPVPCTAQDEFTFIIYSLPDEFTVITS
jgi:hypothetical protein